jgi:hypothetical protein
MLLSISAPKYRNNQFWGVKAFQHLSFCLTRFHHRSLKFLGNFNPGPKLVSSAPSLSIHVTHVNEDEDEQDLRD